MISWHDVRVSLLSMPIPDLTTPEIPKWAKPCSNRGTSPFQEAF